MMVQLVSASVPTATHDESALRSMLAVGGDAEHRVTGAMVFQRGFFLIVLEGEAADVDELYARMCEDPRHASLTLLARRPVARRSRQLRPVTAQPMLGAA